MIRMFFILTSTFVGQGHITAKNIRRFYGKISGNQLPVNFPLILRAPVNIFRNQALYGSKNMYCFWSYGPSALLRYFRLLSVN